MSPGHSCLLPDSRYVLFRTDPRPTPSQSIITSHRWHWACTALFDLEGLGHGKEVSGVLFLPRQWAKVRVWGLDALEFKLLGFLVKVQLMELTQED